MLDKRPVPGHPAYSRARASAVTVCAGGCLDIFSLLYYFSSFPSLW